MKGPIELSPFGTARAAVTSVGLAAVSGFGSQSPFVPEPEIALLGWLRHVREQLRALYNLEDEIAFIAWELARWQPGINLIERQALILLILTPLVHLRLGSTRIVLHGERGWTLRHDFARRLLTGVQPTPGFDALVDPAQAADLMEMLVDSGRAGALVGTADAFKPLVVAGPHLYLQKMLHLEDRFVAAMHSRLATGISGWTAEQVELALHDVCARPTVRGRQTIDLEDEQQAAVRAAVRYPLTIISGGPGTGKTTIVVSVLRVFRRLGVKREEIALAAPTGKAANRMDEAIRAALEGIAEPAEADRDLINLAGPRTLHRLLGYSSRTGRFLHHENNRLVERIVIVDEGSMIDLALMERLVRSLRDDTRFILLGDAHQLPSIEAGAVLRDLLDEDKTSAPVRRWGVWLTHSYRMRRDDDDGRNILTVAQNVDRGILPVVAPTRTGDGIVVERPSVANITFRGVEFLAAPESSGVLNQFLDRWHRDVHRSLADLDELTGHEYALVQGSFKEDDLERLRRLFEHWKGFCILCVTRVLPTGADRVNAILHQHALKQHALQLHARGLPNPPQDGGFIPGEPVMMQVNDYNRMLFNGDQGLVLNVSEEGKVFLMAAFPRSEGFAAFHVESLRPDIQLSYAMTVHKAQGSEFERVALVLPDRDLPITTREILYTALTRSRVSTVIIGSRDIFESGIVKAISRDSGIAEKLQGALCE